MKLFHFSNPVKPEELEAAYAEGMIKRSDLINRAYYVGHCRNAAVAVWSEPLGQFIYLRSKFGDTFHETIYHPADDDGHDLFTPTGKIDISIPEIFEEYKTSLPTLEHMVFELEAEVRRLKAKS